MLYSFRLRSIFRLNLGHRTYYGNYFFYRMKSQPHLPYISDEYVFLFLHSNYYKVKETKETIECYFTLRNNSPDLFTNRDPLLPKNKTILEITLVLFLLKKDNNTVLFMIYFIFYKNF